MARVHSINWELATCTLESWDVLFPEASHAFRELAKIRNRRAIHFNPATDTDDRPLALDAIRHLDEVIYFQFGSFGPQSWLFIDEGECYIKKEAETDPFVRKIYLPNSWLVGPRHFLKFVESRFVLHDDHVYEVREVSDEEFHTLRKSGREAYFVALKASEEKINGEQEDNP